MKVIIDFEKKTIEVLDEFTIGDFKEKLGVFADLDEFKIINTEPTFKLPATIPVYPSFPPAPGWPLQPDIYCKTSTSDGTAND